jgi:hypothetical protein
MKSVVEVEDPSHPRHPRSSWLSTLNNGASVADSRTGKQLTSIGNLITTREPSVDFVERANCLIFNVDPSFRALAWAKLVSPKEKTRWERQSS